MILRRNGLRESLLAGLIALPLALGMGGCKSYDFHEKSRDKGTAIFQGRQGLHSSAELKFSVCNDATYLGEDDSFVSSPIIDYVGVKNTFVCGEPIEFVLESTYGISRPGFRAELIKNGEPVPKMRHMDPRNMRWAILPYPNLEPGNYTVQCYAQREFVGKIDFEVVANPNAGAAGDKR